MRYNYYIEPCQFCITRAKNGADISECGWCGSGEDTRHRSSHEHPGDIVKIPADGYGYPYHDSPHPERKYYKDGRHIPEMDGLAPSDGHIEQTKKSEKTDDTYGLLGHISSSLLLSGAVLVSLKSGFKINIQTMKMALSPIAWGPYSSVVDAASDFLILLLILSPGAFIFFLITRKAFIKGNDLNLSTGWPLGLCTLLFIILPLINGHR